jgi:hypothetical protein
VPDVEVPQIFINGALVALPDTNPPLTALPPDTATRRLLPALLGAALIVLVGLAIYLSFR